MRLPDRSTVAFDCYWCGDSVAASEDETTCPTCRTVFTVAVKVRPVLTPARARAIRNSRDADAVTNRNRMAPGAALIDAVMAAGGAE